MKILLAADGSKDSLQAVDYLIKHRAQSGAPLQPVPASCADKVTSRCTLPVPVIA